MRAAFAGNRLAVVGGLVVLAIALLGILAAQVAPYDPNAVLLEERLRPPSTGHLLGTDQFGRDIWSRILFGARISLVVGMGATGVAFAVGVAAGVLAGFVGGWVDELVMRVIDIVLAFPFIVLAIGLIVVFGASLLSITAVIGLLRVAEFARVSRSSILSLKEREFVTAARVIGQRPLLILLRHLMPNALTPLIVIAPLSIAAAINAEAALSFLGMGVQPPDASWGTVIADGRTYLLSAPWIATFPGLVISITILGYTLVGDGLRDALDPRSQTLTRVAQLQK